VLELKVVRLPQEIAQQMNVPADSKAIYLYRKRYADADPIVRVETYLPYDACSFILTHDFTKESLYQVLSGQETTRITHITRLCEARSANAEDVAVLDIKRGRPIHYFNSFGYNRYGKVIELSVARYRR
ncbi:MAG: UTRA domain-containing protein, partial [Pseudoflavonifractor sp.]